MWESSETRPRLKATRALVGDCQGGAGRTSRDSGIHGVVLAMSGRDRWMVGDCQGATAGRFGNRRLLPLPPRERDVGTVGDCQGDSPHAGHPCLAGPCGHETAARLFTLGLRGDGGVLWEIREMSDEDFTDRVLDGVNGLDGTARRKAVALGAEVPALRDGLQVPSSRMVLMPALGALWAAGLGMEKPGWSRLARQGLLAIALGTVAGKGIKRVVCRARPNEGRDPSRWGKADGKHASFPSGHAINVSALTTAVGLNRGLSPATIVSLGFAAAVGWSSLATERHWASDYAAGMATGVLAGLAAKALDGWAEDQLS
ncbi:hypothetical protein C1S70_13900 [Azospirillum argentinense]|uniref:Phosphatidic acid phosphatase type 2/haloperoxidase domain-containing protein n=2 Tax=Azospirillum argentinense TaxID=2970906 RepID=A0A2K1G0F3_9PROT|nr:hypothetical protein C1S70_13900 [Azospirillum argentinense]